MLDHSGGTPQASVCRQWVSLLLLPRDGAAALSVSCEREREREKAAKVANNLASIDRGTRHHVHLDMH